MSNLICPYCGESCDVDGSMMDGEQQAMTRPDCEHDSVATALVQVFC